MPTQHAFGPSEIFGDKMVAFNSTVSAPFDAGSFNDAGDILVFAGSKQAQSFRPISGGARNT